MLRWPTAAQVRDWLLCLAGVGVVVHETLLTQTERPALLVLAAGMMGLPAIMAGDRWVNGRGGGNGSPPTGSRSGGSRSSRSRR